MNNCRGICVQQDDLISFASKNSSILIEKTPLDYIHYGMFYSHCIMYALWSVTAVTAVQAVLMETSGLLVPEHLQVEGG